MLLRQLLSDNWALICYDMPRRQLLRHQWTLGHHGHVRCREILCNIGICMHVLCRHFLPSERSTGLVYYMHHNKLLSIDGAFCSYDMPRGQLLCTAGLSAVSGTCAPGQYSAISATVCTSCASTTYQASSGTSFLFSVYIRELLSHDGIMGSNGMPRGKLLRHQRTLGFHGHVCHWRAAQQTKGRAAQRVAGIVLKVRTPQHLD